MSTIPSKAFDELEMAIADRHVLTEDLVLAYADLLTKFIKEKKFSDISEARLHVLAKYLDRRIIMRSREDETLRSYLESELMALRADSRKGSDTYNLAACLRFIFVKQSEWDDVAQDPPIYYFFSCLMKIFGDVEMDFVAHFNNVLLKKREA